jgi:hypothetical protein
VWGLFTAFAVVIAVVALRTISRALHRLTYMEQTLDDFHVERQVTIGRIDALEERLTARASHE